MDKIIIQGGKKLKGTVKVGGAKNAALPILFTSLLSDQNCTFKNVPDLMDIHSTILLLKELGVTIENRLHENVLEMNAKNVHSHEAPYDLVRKMRASVLALGPLLARFGKAKVSLPGGCAIGARPINFHLKGLEKLGAKITLENGYVFAEAKKLIGNKIVLDFPSVGATENLMMAASLAQGETVIENAAREPEIDDLAHCLQKMGVQIEGEGSETIYIQGVQSLKALEHSIIGDRIEAGTFLAAALITGGEVTVTGIHSSTLDAVLSKFEETGAQVSKTEDSITVKSKGSLKAVDFSTQPFPGFPTDMQAQFMALMMIADGSSVITENIFENRFMHAQELVRLGADISVKGNQAVVKGVKKLVGAPLMATDLRASASLILGGLASEGKTEVSRIYHLDRGYEKMELKLKSLGAAIERVKA